MLPCPQGGLGMAKSRASKKEHPNLVVAQALWTAVAAGDADAMRDVLAEDVIWISSGRNPLAGVRHGPEEVFDYLAQIGESSEDLFSELDGIYVADDAAIIAYHVTARREDKRLEMDYFLMLNVKGGKISKALMVPVDQYTNDEFWS
jgi:ketosteroid isomerase-like protein